MNKLFVFEKDKCQSSHIRILAMGTSNSRNTIICEDEHRVHIDQPSSGGIPSVNKVYNCDGITTQSNTLDVIYVALYNYTSRTDGDLAFKRNQLLEIIDMSHENWWRARNKTTKMEGYIPSNYVAPVKSIEAEPWYFGRIQRLDAEKLLLKAGNQNGSFLIRESESAHNDYSLSVRFNQEVKHYRVKQELVDNTSTVIFLSRNRLFSTLGLLIEHYCSSADGIVIALTTPCRKSFVAPMTATLSFDMEDNWEIARSTLKFERLLGQGQFGEVHQGLWNETVPVAIKSLKPGTMDPEDFLAEAQLMKEIQHDQLIRLHAVCTKDEPIYIVTELMKNGSLLNYLRSNKGHQLKIVHLTDYSIQIATGMAYLESKNYIHRDLAARNVLVCLKGKIVKIADFGLARFIKEEEYEARAGSKFPLKWTAPEAVSYGKFTIKSDVWSYGILLSELVTYGQVPYPGMSNSELIRRLEFNYRMPMPEKCPLSWYEIMMKTWHIDPLKRPTFEELRSMFQDLHGDGQDHYHKGLTELP